MKYRIVYEVVEQISSRTLEGANSAMNYRSDDIDEFALNGIVESATLQEQQPDGSWESVRVIGNLNAFRNHEEKGIET